MITPNGVYGNTHYKTHIFEQKNQTLPVMYCTRCKKTEHSDKEGNSEPCNPNERTK